MELLYSALEFRPLFLLSTWKDPESRDDRVTAAVLMPSGLNEKRGDIRVEIEEERYLRITVSWPNILMNAENLLDSIINGKCGYRIHKTHPMVSGFRDALHELSN